MSTHDHATTDEDDMTEYDNPPIAIEDATPPRRWTDGPNECAPGRFASVSIVGRSLTSEAGVRAAVAKLTAWLDAPRLAAREKPEVVAEFGGVKLLRTTAGEWGTQETFPVSDGDYPADWYRTEAAARADFRDTTGTSACELCGTYRDDHDVDEDGIYTCTAEHKTACEAACAKKGPTP